MARLVVFLLDAARPDYVRASSMPYLTSLSKKQGIKVLRPSFGFCERAEIFTGTEPIENGFFTAIGYDPVRSEFQRYRWFLWLIRIFEMISFRVLSGPVRKLVRRFFGLMGIRMNSYRIPYKFLHLFSLTEDANEGISYIRNHEKSILKACRDKNLRVSLDCFTSLGAPDLPSDEARLEHLKRSISNDLADVYFVYISHCDELGHHLGPDTKVFEKSLSKLDGLLGDFANWCENSFDDHTNMIFIGDHGMRNVEYRFDIITHIERFIRKFPEVLECYFVDSTLCRFWFKGNEAAQVFCKWANSSSVFIDKGVLVPSSAFEQYGIPDTGRKYGDLVWIANSGVVLEPDFFNGQDSHLKGMHGYIPSEIYDFGFVTSNFIKLDPDEYRLIDVNKILRSAIEE